MCMIIFLAILMIGDADWDQLHPGTNMFPFFVGVAVLDLVLQLSISSELVSIKRRFHID